MLDLAFTNLLDFLARLRNRPAKEESVETDFVPFGDARAEETKTTDASVELSGQEVPRQSKEQ
jgi:hypothetical protein